LIEAFGATVVTGDKAYDGPIPEVVKRRIAESDAVIGFLTKRNGAKRTHRWVIEELAFGMALGKQVLEVRERGVDPQDGAGASAQRIELRPDERDRCLVQIAEALGVWHASPAIKIRIQPEQTMREIMPLVRSNGFRCEYVISSQGRQKAPQPASVQREPGGLIAYVMAVPRNASVQLAVSCGAASWTSGFETPDYLNLTLTKDS
jgi:hypothetical protein